jgi:hypothetical protein
MTARARHPQRGMRHDAEALGAETTEEAHAAAHAFVRWLEKLEALE